MRIKWFPQCKFFAIHLPLVFCRSATRVPPSQAYRSHRADRRRALAPQNPGPFESPRYGNAYQIRSLRVSPPANNNQTNAARRNPTRAFQPLPWRRWKRKVQQKASRALPSRRLSWLPGQTISTQASRMFFPEKMGSSRNQSLVRCHKAGLSSPERGDRRRFPRRIPPHRQKCARFPSQSVFTIESFITSSPWRDCPLTGTVPQHLQKKKYRVTGSLQNLYAGVANQGSRLDRSKHS